MIVKTAEQLKAYLADGGDSERISIMKDPVPLKPNPVIYSGEGRHNTSTYEHGLCKRKHKVLRVDGNLYVFTRIQNEFTGNISGHFRRIYKDKNGYYAKADGRNNYLNGEVEGFLKREAYQKEALEFYKNYKGRIYI